MDLGTPAQSICEPSSLLHLPPGSGTQTEARVFLGTCSEDVGFLQDFHCHMPQTVLIPPAPHSFPFQDQVSGTSSSQVS